MPEETFSTYDIERIIARVKRGGVRKIQASPLIADPFDTGDSLDIAPEADPYDMQYAIVQWLNDRPGAKITCCT